MCFDAGSYRSRIQSRPTNIVPTLNNHIVEATPTVPVTPSTPVATAPSSRITQAFMAPPPVSIKSVHEFNTQQTIITNSQSTIAALTLTRNYILKRF